MTQAEYDEAFPDKPLNGGSPGTGNFRHEVVSESLAVHPSLIETATAEARRLGCATVYDAQGRPVFTDSASMKKHVKRHGYHHRGYW